METYSDFIHSFRDRLKSVISFEELSSLKMLSPKHISEIKEFYKGDSNEWVDVVGSYNISKLGAIRTFKDSSVYPLLVLDKKNNVIGDYLGFPWNELFNREGRYHKAVAYNPFYFYSYWLSNKDLKKNVEQSYLFYSLESFYNVIQKNGHTLFTFCPLSKLNKLIDPKFQDLHGFWLNDFEGQLKKISLKKRKNLISDFLLEVEECLTHEKCFSDYIPLEKKNLAQSVCEKFRSQKKVPPYENLKEVYGFYRYYFELNI